MIPSSLELNSDEFPFLSHLFSRSGSREKLGKSSVENRDHHHWPAGEREQLAVEPTLETLIIKDHPYYKPLCLMMIITIFTSPLKKTKMAKNNFFGGYYQKSLQFQGE